jgi:hypothetical protein
MKQWKFSYSGDLLKWGFCFVVPGLAVMFLLFPPELNPFRAALAYLETFNIVDTLKTILALYLAGVIVALPIKLVRVVIVWIKFRSIIAGNFSRVGLFPNWMTGNFDRPGVVLVGAQGIEFGMSVLTLLLSWIYVLCMALVIPISIYEWISFFFAPSNIKDARWRLRKRVLSKEQVVDELTIILHLDPIKREQLVSEVEERLREAA